MGFSSWAGRRRGCMTFFGPSMTEKSVVEARARKISGCSRLRWVVGAQRCMEVCEFLSYTHAHMCMMETRIARPPTTHLNWELPKIFLALASTTVFPVVDGPNNVMQLCLRPAQDEKPISFMIFCHRSRSEPTTSMMIPGFVTIIVIEVS